MSYNSDNTGKLNLNCLTLTNINIKLNAYTLILNSLTFLYNYQKNSIIIFVPNKT